MVRRNAFGFRNNFNKELKKVKKIISIILVLVLVMGVVSVLTACNDNNNDKDYITVGLECGYAPYNWTQTDDSNGAVKIYNADGYANGYDIMIAKKIAQSLGKKLRVVKYKWEALVPAVASGTLDFIIAGMSPTAERKTAIDFTDVYYNSKIVIVVRKDGAFASAANLDDFNGAKIVAQLGTFHETALQEQGPDHGIIVQTSLDSFPAMINALKSRAVDGYLAEEPGAVADCAANSEFTYIHLENNTTGFTASEEDTAIAIGLKKGSKYKEAINAALANISEQERLNMMNEATELSKEQVG